MMSMMAVLKALDVTSIPGTVWLALGLLVAMLLALAGLKWTWWRNVPLK